jgi:hypothetical protein
MSSAVLWAQSTTVAVVADKAVIFGCKVKVPRATIPALLSAKRLALTPRNWGSTIVAASSGSLGFAVVRACSNAAHEAR